MYIKKIEIKDIRSIRQFEMTFEQPAGWHVLIGENGAGKSTIIKAISLGLIGPDDAKALRINYNDWIVPGSKTGGSIQLEILRHDVDSYKGQRKPLKKPFKARIDVVGPFDPDSRATSVAIGNDSDTISPKNYIWSNSQGWFSAGFGPFRRFTGGDKDWSKVYYSSPRAAAHLTVFGEDVALTEVLEWLKDLQYKKYENKPLETVILESIINFLNEGDLLPNNVRLKSIRSDGIYFLDAYNHFTEITQLSDGYRSILSMIFELIRQFVFVFGYQEVFKNFKDKVYTIDLPGVVLIDEVDAHLHPTWQTQIGQWFTKYFPSIQFIVTTHSPLVCRAAEKGSIWQLPVPGTDDTAREIKGVKRNRLIYGNILDAYGTGLFGDDTPLSESANDKLNELADLNVKSMFGQITPEEEIRLVELKSIFSTQG